MKKRALLWWQVKPLESFQRGCEVETGIAGFHVVQKKFGWLCVFGESQYYSYVHFGIIDSVGKVCQFEI